MMMKLNFYSLTNEIISDIIAVVTYKSSDDQWPSFETRTGPAGRPGLGTSPGLSKNPPGSWPGKTRSTRRVDPGKLGYLPDRERQQQSVRSNLWRQPQFFTSTQQMASPNPHLKSSSSLSLHHSHSHHYQKYPPPLWQPSAPAPA